MTAPAITQADIDAAIATEHYFTARQALIGSETDSLDDMPYTSARALARLTICVIVLKNGFVVTGESACVHQDNFDADLGRKYARDSAVEKMWPLLGYGLREQLHQGTKA